MAKGKKSDKRPARGRYRLNGIATRNKERNIMKEMIRQDWYKGRNALMKTYNLSKTLAKRAFRLVMQGKEEKVAAEEVRKGVTP